MDVTITRAESDNGLNCWMDLQYRIASKMNQHLRPATGATIDTFAGVRSQKRNDDLIRNLKQFRDQLADGFDGVFLFPDFAPACGSRPDGRLAFEWLDDFSYYGLKPLQSSLTADAWRNLYVEPLNKHVADVRQWFDSLSTLWDFKDTGLFRFRGDPYDLTNVPREMLRIFVETKHKDSFDEIDLRPALKDDLASRDTVRSHLKVLRAVLRKVATTYG